MEGPPGLPFEDIMQLADQFIESLPCRAPGDYPEARVDAPDPDYALLLLDAYANGTSAELTAVTQYIFHHLDMRQHDVSNLELCIALVEMKHLSLVGQLIEALGLPSKYWRTNLGYWKGSNVMYGMGTCQQLKMDIESEKAAINGYERLISEARDPGVIRVLQRIIEDERVHLALFETALTRYCG